MNVRAANGGLVLGLGCQRGMSSAAIARTVQHVLALHAIPWPEVRAIATSERKVAEPGLLRFAEEQALSLVFYAEALLAGDRAATEPAARASHPRSRGGVAEPAARRLARTGRLLLGKTIAYDPLEGRSLTLAVARMTGGGP
jgi:cobalt-precorrin 5A hydrolase